MRRFEWQHVGRTHHNGYVESEYLLADEAKGEAILENMSIEEVKALAETCQNMIRYDEMRSHVFNGKGYGKEL